jgi:hypothetical protein
VTAAYSIANGKVVTTFDQERVEVTVYKMGDSYHAARSNEFGYVNYEIVPKVPEPLHPLGKNLMPDPSQAADQAKYFAREVPTIGARSAVGVLILPCGAIYGITDKGLTGNFGAVAHFSDYV